MSDRPNTIGGTDVAAILGVHPYKSALDVWARLCGYAEEQPDNPRMAWGRRLEPVVLDAYEEATGTRLDRGGIVTRTDAPWAHGSIDARVPGGVIVDAKTTRQADRYGEPGTSEVPDEVNCQVQHYAWLGDAPEGHVAVLVSGSDFRIYCVPRDDELIGMQRQVCERFWRDHVLTKTPPALDGSEACARYLARRWPRNTAPLIVATPEVENAARGLRDFRRELARIEARAGECENVIKAAIAEAEGVEGTFGRITWRAGKPAARIDVDRLRRERPDVAREFTVTAPPARRFLVPRAWGEKE